MSEVPLYMGLVGRGAGSECGVSLSLLYIYIYIYIYIYGIIYTLSLRLGGAEPFRRGQGPGEGRSESQAALRPCSHTHHTIFTKWSNRHWSNLTTGQI